MEIHSNCKVTAVTDGNVTLTDGTTVTPNTLVWTAGTCPNSLMDTLPCEKARGPVLVNEYLEIPEWSGFWALSDSAVVPDRNAGESHPPTAQHALREGKVAAQNILATLRSDRKKPFPFTTIGRLIPIGKRTGVANILGVKFSDFMAWWLWRTIYLLIIAPILRESPRGLGLKSRCALFEGSCPR